MLLMVDRISDKISQKSDFQSLSNRHLCTRQNKHIVSLFFRTSWYTDTVESSRALKKSRSIKLAPVLFVVH